VATEQIADMNETTEGSGKDRPLRDDIRLLGRILGDTVREQEGEAVFDIVERIRQTSIRFHRDNDEAARRALEAILNDLSPGQTVQIVRAFSYFSHLANIAEDQDHIRRTRAQYVWRRAPPPLEQPPLGSASQQIRDRRPEPQRARFDDKRHIRSHSRPVVIPDP
jgi:Phosphoenolpyruvate carboxylase